MYSRSLDPVVKRNMESAMMTSAVMSSHSAVDKKRKSWISDDEVSSDVSNQQRATVQPIQQMLFALITNSRKIPVARYQSQGTSRRVYQSQDDEPVAGYNAPSRRLQCFAYPVAGNTDAGKADVVKICKPVDKESNAKKQRK
ncbi:hypothetical protein F511_29973 [Dorcoceras hygrometricum]|uniref:Uncharacterized protein n=1 Tax=Dorcoceras hygrometricum TaxID=472368 RepID=A0A2Z7CNK6_9LAMI|nr:hypothetical protein F511_29973 [Dorcoceras hygrometricum]